MFRIRGAMQRRRCERCQLGFPASDPALIVGGLYLHNACWIEQLDEFVAGLPPEVAGFVDGWRLAVETWGRTSPDFHRREAVQAFAEQALALWEAGRTAGAPIPAPAPEVAGGVT
jgi:hypothetical protein